MNWPWVSRRAFDMVCDERDRLREQNDGLIATYKQMQRIRAGLPAVERQVQKPAAPEAIPGNIRDLIAGFGSKAVRDQLSQQVREMRRAGTPFKEIHRILQENLDEVVAEAS